MKTKFLIPILALALCVGLFTFTGCSTTGGGGAQQVAYQTLTSFGSAVSSSYQGYLYTVAVGKTPTNDVVSITTQYRQFQALYNAACDAAAAAGTNFVSVPPDVMAAGTALQTRIATANTK